MSSMRAHVHGSPRVGARSDASVLTVLCASYRDLTLQDLQRLSGGAQQLTRSLVAGPAAAMPGDPGAGAGPITGAVVLTTCNRVEIYIEAPAVRAAVGKVITELAAACGSDHAVVARQLTVTTGTAVAEHLFAVASGLDSMVPGEAEISGQVARALSRAQDDGTVSPTLNLLFQSAARLAKNVASRTALGATGRSIGTVALDIAEAAAGSLAGKSALIIGTGSYARVLAHALRSRGCTELCVFSSSDRAAAFAATHAARSVSALQLPAALAAVDLVVACSGTTGGALSPEMITASGRTRPLTVVDLALRPDISNDVRAMPGVRVIDLETVSGHEPGQRSAAVTAAQELLTAAVTEFENDLAVRALDPAVIALRSHITGIAETELHRLRGRYDQSVAATMELALHRVIRSLMHTPTLRAQELARGGNGAGYVAALHTVFGLDP